MNMDKNFFVKRLIPMMTKRKLTAEEKDAYAAPYPDRASRKPVAVWPREIPFDGEPSDVHDAVSGYWQWLQKSETPKLMLYASPGAIIKKDVAADLKSKLPNLTSVHIGKGIHYVQEDQPDAIGDALAAWLPTLS
jgi:haloalkane dehalogenase